jgi:hypothetical protein
MLEDHNMEVDRESDKCRLELRIHCQIAILFSCGYLMFCQLRVLLIDVRTFELLVK